MLKAVEFYNGKDSAISTSLNFLHLSLQETLAAYYISLLPKKQQVELLKNTFFNARFFNTWIMYVGLTKGQYFAFKHFLSGNRFQLFTSISLLLYGSPGVSKKLIANKILCLHLFQCFSEAENDEMCQYVGQLLKDGEIDLSGQTLSAVNIHTLGLFLDRSSVKHWKLLNLSNCHLGTQEIEKLCKFCCNVHIYELDVSYNNLTGSLVDVLTKTLVVWKVKKAILQSENGEELSNIINHHIRHFPTDILVPFQTEIIPTELSILVICKYSYLGISTFFLNCKSYSNVHLFSCQLGNTSDEVTRMAYRLSKNSKRIYLYDCSTSFLHALESAMMSKNSSFHFIRGSSTSSENIRCAVEKLAEFSITLGEDVLPLHIVNMTERCLQDVKDFLQENTCGTFVFKYCNSQEIVEILLTLSSPKSIRQFVLKKYANFSKKHFSALFGSIMSLQYLNLFNCRLQNHFMKALCHVLKIYSISIILF